MKSPSLQAIASVGYKEFLHIYRDRRVLVLLLILPPLFTLIFGHAFEANEMTNVPARLINRDHTAQTQRFVNIVTKNKTFQWRQEPSEVTDESDLLGHHVWAALVIPQGWSDTLKNGDPKPLPFYLDGSDTNTATALEGAVRESLADFQAKERDLIVENLPDEVIELGKKLPVEVQTIRLAHERVGRGQQNPLQPEDALHRLCGAWNHRFNFAIADGHANGLHDRARTRIRHALPADGDVTAARRNRHR